MISVKDVDSYFDYEACDNSKVNELVEQISAASNSQVIFKKDAYYDESKSVAYCYKKYGNYFVHDTKFMDESTENYARMHELSHIRLGHLDLNKGTIHKTFENTVLPHLPNIRKRFEADITNNKIIDYLYIQMSNIAQDMEINSTVYGSTESWKNAEKAMQKAFIIGCIENGKEDLAEQYFNSVKAHDGKFELCHPINKNWPCGLSWINYIIMLAKDEDAMNKALDDAQDKIENSGDSEEQDEQNNKNGQKGSGSKASNSGSGESDGQDENEDEGNDRKESDDSSSDGKSNKSDGSNGSGKSKPSNCGANRPKLSKKQLEDAIDAAVQMSGDKSLDSANKPENGIQFGAGSGFASKSITLCTDSDADLAKFIKKNFTLKKTSVHSDQMYYANRNKFGSGAPIIPRRTSSEQFSPTTCHFLVDISGSMNEERILKNIATIKELFGKGLDAKKSHIILCNSTVQADYTLDKIPSKIDIGGGTQLVQGLRHIAINKYMNKNAKLFIMSDFEDYTVPAWKDAMSLYKGEVCGIYQEGCENKKLMKFDKNNIAADVESLLNA